MVSSSTIFSTLITTENVWIIPMLRFSHGKKRVLFRNGFQMDLNWSDYCILRDIFSKGFDVEELSGGMFCLKKNNMKIVGPLPHIGVLAEDTEDFGIIDFHNKVLQMEEAAFRKSC